MPLQRFDVGPVTRPSGLVAPEVPLDGVTEIRVHGVGGTTAESLLGDAAPLQVSGDRIAGFYRTVDADADVSAVPAGRGARHIEAYSWGGLTSRSGTRALWLFLFPFALANLAGWMCTPRVHERPWLFWLHRATVRWASLGLTVNFILIAVMMFVDLAAYQCGAQAACVADRWWLAPLRWSAFVLHPGRRVVLGALPPLLLVALLLWLTWRSLTRYEQVEPPYTLDRPRRGSRRGAAVRGRGLTHPLFWDGGQSTRRLGLLHIAVALALLATVVAHVANTTSSTAGLIVGLPWLWALGLVASGVVIVASLVLLALDRCADWLPLALTVAAFAALVAALVFAWTQPPWSPATYGPLPGVRNASKFAWAAVLASAALVTVPSAMSGRVRRGFVLWGPATAMGVGSLILNLVGLALLIRFAALLAPVSFGPPQQGSTGPVVYVSAAIGQSMPNLALAVLILLLVFAGYQGVRYLRAGLRRADRDAIRRVYVGLGTPTGGEHDWTYSVLTDKPASQDGWDGPPDRRGERWISALARARRLAKAPRDVDKLLTAMAASGALVGLGLVVSTWIDVSPPSARGLLLRAGSAVVTILPFLLLGVLRNGWRSLDTRRRLGMLWDVSTFWPRSYHPLAPPSYAERAVPELQRRLWRIHDNGGSVVIAAHSQGSVITAAALLQTERRPNDASIALATFGAPLRKLYGWAFPYYFRDEVLRELAEPAKTHLAAWRNYYYLTDYIGGAALEAPAPEVDKELLDPSTSWMIYGQPPPVTGRHSGYWNDPVMWSDIDELADLVARRDPFAAAAQG